MFDGIHTIIFIYFCGLCQKKKRKKKKKKLCGKLCRHRENRPVAVLQSAPVIRVTEFNVLNVSPSIRIVFLHLEKQRRIYESKLFQNQLRVFLEKILNYISRTIFACFSALNSSNMTYYLVADCKLNANIFHSYLWNNCYLSDI